MQQWLTCVMDAVAYNIAGFLGIKIVAGVIDDVSEFSLGAVDSSCMFWIYICVSGAYDFSDSKHYKKESYSGA